MQSENGLRRQTGRITFCSRYLQLCSPIPWTRCFQTSKLPAWGCWCWRDFFCAPIQARGCHGRRTLRSISPLAGNSAERAAPHPLSPVGIGGVRREWRRDRERRGSANGPRPDASDGQARGGLAKAAQRNLRRAAGAAGCGKESRLRRRASPAGNTWQKRCATQETGIGTACGAAAG